ncbi:MAG: DUF2244 domain-containing protein [Pseudomonadota bacterium]
MTPILELRLRPYRSLTREGVLWVFGIVLLALIVTLVPFLGTSVAWVLVGFKVLTLLMLGGFLLYNERAATLEEHLILEPARIRVERREPGGRRFEWEANPYWVEARLHPNHKVENYLTLRGAGREIELGAFLTPGARTALYDDITRALSRLR